MPARSLTENDEDRPPRATSRLEEGRKMRVLATVASVVLVAGGFAAWNFWPSSHAKAAPPAPCPACVTNGVPPFEAGSQPMRMVQAAIASEDATVKAKFRKDGQPYVTVALLSPFTTEPQGDVTLPRMLDQLWGAYLAQLSMNASGGLGVQLILANEGTSSELTAGQAARQLETLEGPDHLVAVAGLGLSITATETAAKTLARNGLPMFGAVTTADQLSGSLFNKNPAESGVLVQVVPDIDAQVRKLAEVIIPKPANAVLVVDQQATDLYTADVKADFSRVFSASLIGAYPWEYTPGPGAAGVLGEVAHSECYGNPPDILYAGRASVLASFVKALQRDPNCHNAKITIITASDGDGLAPDATKSAAGQGRVSVIYSDIVDLSQLPNTFKTTYRNTLAKVDPAAAGLKSTWMVATYDSMMAASDAIHAAYTAPPAWPSKEDVKQSAENLRGMDGVAGATGKFLVMPGGQIIDPDIPVFEDKAGKRSDY